MDHLPEAIPGFKDSDGGIKLIVVLDNYRIHERCDVWVAAYQIVSILLTQTSQQFADVDIQKIRSSP
jgi:hypothetical protein